MSFICIENEAAEFIQHRRHLHRNPELSYKEFETSNYITTYLKSLGYEVHHPQQTGCVAILKGEKSDRVIALRADIDALPIEEEGAFKSAFKSQNQGVAHCCGHDVHTTNLMWVAKQLMEIRDQILGKIILIFQPAEEKLPGGGRLLCESGFLDDLEIQRIYGLHTAYQLSLGKIGVKNGAFMARPDEFIIRVKGKGGHAASPHLAVDSIVIASQIVLAIQTIISRNIDPVEKAVITIGSIQGGSAHNVIPEVVELKGTIRSFSKDMAHFLAKRVETVAKSIADGGGAYIEFQYDEGYPAVINDEKCTDNIRMAVNKHYGEEALVELEQPIMAGEDFAFYQEKFRGSFFLLGSNSEESESVYPWHHPRYNVDERAMKIGATLLTELALHG